MRTVVYWLFDETCICPRLHGYVGISARFMKRLKEHRRPGKFPPFQYAILLSGADDECFALEQQLRPGHNIGWNRSRGGPNQGRTLDYAHTDETRAKVSAALKGREIRWCDKLSAASMGHVHGDAARAAMSAASKGKPKSAAHRAAMSEAAKRRYVRAGEREKTATAVRAALAALTPDRRRRTGYASVIQ